MPVENRLAELLACPRCDKALDNDGKHYRCTACKTDFPFVGDIPWLFAEPDASLGEWRNRLHFALQQLAHESGRLKSELKTTGISNLTRRRLEQQIGAKEEHSKALRRILAPVDVQTMQASYESYLALRTRLPADQGLNTYYANVHRDWSWGETENDISLQQIRAVAGADSDLGDTLILGSGACRLAYDIHMQLNTARTVALDFNPLLLLIAKIMISGKSAELYEFPIAPRSMDDFAVLRELSAPQPVREDFYLVAADVLRAPFSAAAFDTVVTPWLIDIVSENLPVFAKRINRLLKPGGRWMNFGSLAFDHPQRARCYSPEEALEIVQVSGFTEPRVIEATIPYMCSPASRHGRQEIVFTFSAEKTSEAEIPERHKALPDWIVTGKEAVPLTPSFRTQAMSTQIYTFIMSLIDGKRTIKDMAKIIEQKNLMSSAEAEAAIRTFLTRMYDDSQRNSGF